jgi:succinate dehydrogenase/fumarate reductase cytochrome b subunit
MPAAAAESKTSYILDKLQSLSGVIPIGAYLIDHLWSNSYALVSADKYNQVSGDLQTVPWRILIEAGVLWIPILFHGCYGIYIWWKGKSNALGHPWMSNWMYTCCSAGPASSRSYLSAGTFTPNASSVRAVTRLTRTWRRT